MGSRQPSSRPKRTAAQNAREIIRVLRGFLTDHELNRCIYNVTLSLLLSDNYLTTHRLTRSSQRGWGGGGGEMGCCGSLST